MTQTYSVLFVSNNAWSAMELARRLGAEGHHTWLSTGSIGIEVADPPSQFDAVLIDEELPRSTIRGLLKQVGCATRCSGPARVGSAEALGDELVGPQTPRFDAVPFPGSPSRGARPGRVFLGAR